MSSSTIKSHSPEDSYPGHRVENHGKKANRSVSEILNTPGKRTGAVFGTVAIAAAIAIPIAVGSSQETSAKPETAGTGTEQGAKLTYDQELMQNIMDRPAVGSPEYIAQFNSLQIPYIEGQEGKEVVANAANSILKWTELGVEVLPGTGRSLTNWQVDTGKSVSELVDIIQPSYYDSGAASAIIGIGWENTDFGKYAVPNYAQIHFNRLAAIGTGDVPASSKVEMIDPGIISADTNDIYSVTKYTTSGVGVVAELSMHLHATDLDGDSVPDVWNMIGPAS